jgi:hypothetical protein
MSWIYPPARRGKAEQRTRSVAFMEYNDAQDVQSCERRRINQQATLQKISLLQIFEEAHKVFHFSVAL